MNWSGNIWRNCRIARTRDGMHMLYALHEVPAVPWWMLQLVCTHELALGVIHNGLLLSVIQAMNTGVIKHENALMEGLLVSPLFVRSLDYFFQAINPFWLIHSSRRPPRFPLFHLYGDAQIRRRGPKPNRNKEEIIADFMVLEAGEGAVPSSEKKNCSMLMHVRVRRPTLSTCGF
jgi:hypothetical protein